MKWRKLNIGKYTLSIAEHRSVASGIGHELGIGLNVESFSHVLYRNGVKLWEKTYKYDVRIDTAQRLKNSHDASRGRTTK